MYGDAEEFDIKVECGVGGNAREVLGAIGKFWWDDELGCAAFAHQGNTFIPARNDIAHTEGKFDGFTAN